MELNLKEFYGKRFPNNTRQSQSSIPVRNYIKLEAELRVKLEAEV